MNEKKNNIRSMRFSDDTIQLINQQTGSTFTAKFEALVTRCIWELPAAEKRLEDLKQEQEQARQKIFDMRRRIQIMNTTIMHLQTTIDRAIGDLEKL